MIKSNYLKQDDSINNINFNSDVPFSELYNDIYFDINDGCKQSEIIFIQANNIAQRITKKNNIFTIFETGFGTGLNFLLTLRAYQEAQLTNECISTINFISVEKHPLSKAQLIQSLSLFPELNELAQQLINQYPDNISKKTNSTRFEASFFDKRVTLSVIFNDATLALSNIKSPSFGLVDAWYLDGFSPAKNPDMWSKALFAQIARLSKEQATLTTFTVAGFIKRQLRDIGFRVKKLSTLNKKKEIFYAVFQSNPISKKGYQLRPSIIKPQHVSIIGGGIASACAAYALTKQGVKVNIYCQESTVAQGASSNAIGALYPLLHQKIDDISDFYQHAFWRAKALYNELSSAGFHFDHDWCGLLEISYNDSLRKRQQQFTTLSMWPENLIYGVNKQQASTISGIDLTHGGLFMPNAGWVSPVDLVKQLFNAAKKTGRLKIHTNTKIKTIEPVIDHLSAKNNLPVHTSTEIPSWILYSDNEQFEANVLVICGGADAIKLNIVNKLPLVPTRGQVTSMKTNSRINKLSTVICHKGYLTPKNNNIHCIGATFEKNSTDTNSNTASDEYNLRSLSKCLPKLSDLIHWSSKDIQKSKARLRCMTPDHMPLVGAMPDINAHIKTYPHLAKDKNWKYSKAAPVINNLYVMTGFGARGLCSAPLAADILTADLCGTPYPVDNKMLYNLSPNRFVIRDIIRRKFD